MSAKAIVCASLVFLATVAGSESALATLSRTFVSTAGADTGTCPPTAPCRSFAYAMAQTSPAGELVVLNPGGYGPVTITQAISIVNDGIGTVSLTAPSGGPGITIQAGTSDVVQLRGLEIQGANVATNGIS